MEKQYLKYYYFLILKSNNQIKLNRKKTNKYLVVNFQRILKMKSQNETLMFGLDFLINKDIQTLKPT